MVAQGGKEPACPCLPAEGHVSVILGVEKIPWRRKRQPTPAFLPGDPSGQRSLRGWQSMGSPRVRHDWAATILNPIHGGSAFRPDRLLKGLPFLIPSHGGEFQGRSVSIHLWHTARSSWKGRQRVRLSPVAPRDRDTKPPGVNVGTGESPRNLARWPHTANKANLVDSVLPEECLPIGLPRATAPTGLSRMFSGSWAVRRRLYSQWIIPLDRLVKIYIYTHISGEGTGSRLQRSCLENPWTEEPSGLQPTGSQSRMWLQDWWRAHISVSLWLPSVSVYICLPSRNCWMLFVPSKPNTEDGGDLIALDCLSLTSFPRKPQTDFSPCLVLPVDSVFSSFL